jgi:lipoate-protein ligase A
MTRDWRNWRWIRSGALGAAENMALDEALLRAEPIVPTLRTYTWDPWTLSLGYFQAADADRLAEARAQGFGVVRRPTGGGAIFHGPELTYAVICPLGEPGFPREVEGAYHVVHGFLAVALQELGVAVEMRGDRTLRSDGRNPGDFWCFYHSTSFDLVLGDRKLVGSAQRRSGRGFLMHGSIPVAANAMTPRAAAANVSGDALEEAIARAAEAVLRVRMVPGTPTREEQAAAVRLAAERYARPEWLLRR